MGENKLFDEIPEQIDRFDKIIRDLYQQSLVIAENYLGFTEGTIKTIQSLEDYVSRIIPRNSSFDHKQWNQLFRLWTSESKNLGEVISYKLNPIFTVNTANSFFGFVPVVIFALVPDNQKRSVAILNKKGEHIDTFSQIYKEKRVPRIEIRPNGVVFATETEEILLSIEDQIHSLEVLRSEDSDLNIPYPIFRILSRTDDRIFNPPKHPYNCIRIGEYSRKPDGITSHSILLEAPNALGVEGYYNQNGDLVWIRTYYGSLTKGHYYGVVRDRNNYQNPEMLSNNETDSNIAHPPVILSFKNSVRIENGEDVCILPEKIRYLQVVEQINHYLQRKFHMILSE
jgi:hypothetical protein